MMLGTGPGLGNPQEDAPGPGTQLTLPLGPCGSHAATGGSPEMHLLHFIAVRVSFAGVFHWLYNDGEQLLSQGTSFLAYGGDCMMVVPVMALGSHSESWEGE